MSVPVQAFVTGRREIARGSSTNLILLAALAAIACPAAASASAEAGPPPAFVYAIAASNEVDSFGPAHSDGCTSPGNCWTMDAAATHNLTLSATGGVSGNIGQWIGSGASIAYTFIVSGPEDLVVPLSIKGFVSAHASGPVTYATAWIAYDNASRQVTACSATAQSCGGVLETAVLDDSYVTTPGVLNYVHLVASGSMALDGAFSAFADPTITIDPIFLAAHPGFSLAFSPDVINGGGGAVPEPTTWVLMLTGFGLAGGALRRRRAALAA